MDKQTMQQELMESFEFTEDDLKFNRSGLLSPEQKELIERDARRQLLIFLIAPIGIYGLAYLKDPEQIGILLTPTSLVLTFALLAYAFGRPFWKGRKALQGNVEQVSGFPEVKYHSRNFINRRSYYEVFVGEKKFRGPDKGEIEFSEGFSYTFYYSPYLDWPFSIESQ